MVGRAHTSHLLRMGGRFRVHSQSVPKQQHCQSRKLLASVCWVGDPHMQEYVCKLDQNRTTWSERKLQQTSRKSTSSSAITGLLYNPSFRGVHPKNPEDCKLSFHSILFSLPQIFTHPPNRAKCHITQAMYGCFSLT